MPMEDVLRSVETEVARAREEGRRDAEQDFVGVGAVAITLSAFAAAADDLSQRLRSTNPTISEFLGKQAGLFREVSSPPRVVSTDPGADAADVATDAIVAATFEAKVEPATLKDGFTVAPAAGGQALQAELAYDGGTKTATLTPANGLTPGVEYKAKVDGVTNRGGIGMAPYEWTFTVAEAAPAEDA